MFPRKPRQFIAEGFKDDAFKVLQQFKERGQYTLPDFIKLWNENHMSMIYLGRTSHRELCEFTNECFMMVITLLRHKNSPLEARAAAFYLLYCLYGSQPLSKYKIRITVEDNSLMCDLLERAREAKLVSLVYAIMKLKHIHAFHIVGNITLMGPEIPSFRTVEMEENILSLMADTHWSQYIKSFYESQAFQEYILLHKTYESMKEAVGYLNSGAPKDDGAECIRMFEKIALGETNISQILDNDKNASGEQEGEFQDIGARRAFLKEQQMVMHTDAMFSTTSLKPEILSDTDDSSDLPLAEVYRKRPYKRKKHQLMDQSEEEEELNELGLSIALSPNDSSCSSKSSNEIAKHIFKDDNQSTKDDVSSDFNNSDESPRRHYVLRSRLSSKSDIKEVISSDQEEYKGYETVDASDSDYYPVKPKVQFDGEFVKPDQNTMASCSTSSIKTKTKLKCGKLKNKRGQHRIQVEKRVRRRIRKGKHAKVRRHYAVPDNEDAFKVNRNPVSKRDDDTSDDSDIDDTVKIRDDPYDFI